MPSLSFARRANLRRLPTGSERRAYRSEDGRYVVIEVRHEAGRYWLAARQLNGGQEFISRHRTRAGAEAACVNHRSA